MRQTATVTLLHGRADRRDARRFGAAMPMRVDGHAGMTRDLSTSGLSFHSDVRPTLGAQVEVVIDYLLDGHHFPLRCVAVIARVQPHGNGFLAGARIVLAGVAQNPQRPLLRRVA
jgi:hypothetical protein